MTITYLQETQTGCVWRHGFRGETLSVYYHESKYWICRGGFVYATCDTAEELGQILQEEAAEPYSLRRKSGNLPQRYTPAKPLLDLDRLALQLNLGALTNGNQDNH